MRRISALISLVAVLAALGNASLAQDKKKEGGFPAVQPGPEHKVLASLAGTFEAKVKMFSFVDPKAAPMESTGVMTRKMVLGGNFLQETFKGKFLDKEFTGMGMIGYDPAKKKYVTTWYDSMSLSTTIMYGTYDKASKTFTNVGDEIDAGGKKMKGRDVLKLVSKEEQTFEMYRQPEGGPEFKVMEITYLRKTVEKKKAEGK